jgi:putative ABC transport system permease protein
VSVHDVMEAVAGVRSGAFRFAPVALAVLAGVAVLTGVLAALVPAWIAGRQDVVAALAGRRGITRSRRRWVIVGAAIAAGGAALTLAGAYRGDWGLIVLGLILVEVSLILCTPALVGLVARLGQRLPLAPRIALRDTSRNRTAAAPAISAVMAAVVGTVMVGVVLAAANAQTRNGYRSLSAAGTIGIFNAAPKLDGGASVVMPPEVVTALRANLPIDQVYQVSVPACDTGLCLVEVRPQPGLECPYLARVLRRDSTPAEQRAARRDARCTGAGQVVVYFGGVRSDSGITIVVDPATVGPVANLAAGDVEPVAAALRRGEVVVGGSKYLDNAGQVTLSVLEDLSDPSKVRAVTAPGFVAPHGLVAPLTIMTESTARSVGLSVSPWILVATTTQMPTRAQVDAAQFALGERYPVYLEEGPHTENVGLAVLTIIAAVITLGAAAIATGLTAVDRRADLATLGAVGASPTVRRMLSLSQSGVIAGLGSVTGVLVGCGAAIAVLFMFNRHDAAVFPAPTPYPLTIPWWNVGVALVVVPLIAMLGAGVLTRSRLPIERRL